MEAKKNRSLSDLGDRIELIERRLENRRARLLDQAHESAHAAGDAVRRVAPIAAAVGAGLVAMYLVRGRGRRSPRYAFRGDDGFTPSEQRRTVRWASIAGILGTAFRIATSPQVRALVQHYRERHARR